MRTGLRRAAPYGMILLPILLALCVRQTVDWDLYWHLATGKLALSHLSTLPTEPFSFSRQGAPWIYKDLAADVLLYLGFSGLGYVWFAVLKVLAVVVIACALRLALPAGQRHLLPWVVALGALLGSIQYRISERPLLFSLACFPLMLALIERARRLLAQEPAHALRALGPPIALQWAWIQLHREALLGLGLLLGLALHYSLGALVSRVPGCERLLPLWRDRPSRRVVLWAWGGFAAAAVLCLLNPFGPGTLTSAFAVAKSPMLKQAISEWKTLPPAELLRAFPVAMGVSALALCGLGVRLGIALRRRAAGPADLFHLGLLLALLLQVFSSVRWVPWLAIQAALCGLLLLEEQACSLGRPLPRGLGALCGVMVVGLLFWRDNHGFGLGETPDHFPREALAFAEQHHLRQRVVNAFPFGGYVIWRGSPALRVLVDGRNDTVYPPALILDSLAAEADPRRFAAMRAVDHADWVLALNRAGGETHAFLATDPAWALVFWSEAAVVYVRRDAYPQLAQQEGFVLLHPVQLIGSVGQAAQQGDPAVLAALERELSRLLAASPDGVRPGAALAYFYDTQGPSHRAQRDAVIRRLVQVHPEHPVVQRLQRLIGD